MQKRTWTKIARLTIFVFLFLVLVLGVHIYIVTRPKPLDEKTKVMVRIDIHQPITQDDATKISDWLYHQQGVDHVLVNPQSEVAVFTYSPLKNDANRIVSDFKANLPYKAERFLPTKEQMTGGCPAMATTGYKVLSFFKNIF